MGLCRQHRQRRSLSLSGRRSQGVAARRRRWWRACRTDRRHSTRDIVFTPDGKRMLVSVGSASNVAEGMGTPARRARGVVEGAAARRGLGLRDRARGRARLRSRRQGSEALCHRHPQLRRPCDPAADRAALVLDQRARRPRRRSRARLRHQREGGRASTAGRGSTSATTKIRAMPARGRTSRTR